VREALSIVMLSCCMIILKAVRTILYAPDDGRKKNPKHVDADNNKEHSTYKLHLVGYIKYTKYTKMSV
jgi:hypothetical protein